MSNSSYTNMNRASYLRNQPKQIASKWIVYCACRKFIEFYMNSSSFHKTTLKINLLLFFIYNLVYNLCKLCHKKKLNLFKGINKKNPFLQQEWYRNSTHLEMNYKSFNLFTILHPKKQKYTNRSKQTNKQKIKILLSDSRQPNSGNSLDI